MKTKKALRRLEELLAEIDALVASAAGTDDLSPEWVRIYDAVFGPIGERAWKALRVLGVNRLDYYDPDTTYGEDARAWIDAFRAEAKRLLAGSETA